MQTYHYQNIYPINNTIPKDQLATIEMYSIFGVWLVLLGQYNLVEGIATAKIITNFFVLAFLTNLLVIYSLRKLFFLKIIKDVFALQSLELAYITILHIIFWLKKDMYIILSSFTAQFEWFIFLTLITRLFWSFKSPASKLPYSWPAIHSFFSTNKQNAFEKEDQSTSHIVLVILTLILNWQLAKILTSAPKGTLQYILGFASIIVFFRHFYPVLLKQIESFIAASAISEKLNEAEIQVETMSSTITELTNQVGQKFSPDQIQLLTQLMDLPQSQQNHFKAAVNNLATKQAKANTNDTPEPPNRPRTTLALVVTGQTTTEKGG